MSYKLLFAISAAALSFALPAAASAQTAPPLAPTRTATWSLAVPREANPQTSRYLISTKAKAEKWEIGYLALSAIDAAETISCLNRNVCTEDNPIWGRHPSTAKIVLTKLGLGAAHFAIFKVAERKSPRTALLGAQLSAILQAGIVGLNFRTAFK